MAGDWIKMCKDLLTHPKVMQMTDLLNGDKCHADSVTKNGQMSRMQRDENVAGLSAFTDHFRVVGGLLSVWSIFDSHSTDGILKGYSLDRLDKLAGWPGLSAAMVSVGWLIVRDGVGLEVPEFDAHNGQSAKKRAVDARRKQKHRDNNVTQLA